MVNTVRFMIVLQCASCLCTLDLHKIAIEWIQTFGRIITIATKLSRSVDLCLTG